MDQYAGTLDALQKIVKDHDEEAQAPEGLRALCQAMEDDLDDMGDEFETSEFELVINAAKINPNVAIEVGGFRISLAEVA